jgi:hypothetical protein
MGTDTAASNQARPPRWALALARVLGPAPRALPLRP